MSQFERQEKSRRKHQPFNSGASRAPVAPPVQRPGWKGPSFIKKTVKTARPPPKSSSSSETPNIQEQLLPLELQQLILNIYRTTFPISQDPDALKPVLQEIKSALFDRSFEKAFASEEWREAYTVRWSPGRALAYANLLSWIVGGCGEEKWVQSILGTMTESRQARVLCFGGGAAETMTFGALLNHLRSDSCGKSATNLSKLTSDSQSLQEPILEIQLVDAAPWKSVVSKLHGSLTSPPQLSKYASASARASNTSLLSPNAMKVNFTHANLFDLEQSTIKPIIGDIPVLITLFFTLNELYTASVSKTTKFLLELSRSSAEDTLLCIIDSPGSYSEAAIGKGDEKKKYPMHWLMDHALLGKIREEGQDENEEAKGCAMWEKILVDESRWFRIQESLKYPISLKNMRFQVHLFRRI